MIRPHLKEFHIDEKKEKQIRKNFTKFSELPKILIVTEKLLTGFDAPILYAMYLDKPMRDHTLLQAIARVNRPYENEREEMIKPHGFVLDFVGIFDKLEKALRFDSDEVSAVVKDLQLLKALFQTKIDDLTYFVYRTLILAAVKDPEGISKKIKAAFIRHANWLRSDNEMRELRKQITLAIYAHEDDLDKVTEIVDRLLALIQQAQKKSK